MSAIITKIEESATWNEKQRIALFHFSHAATKSKLRAFAMNGDNVNYIYPVDLLPMYRKETEKAEKLLELARSEFEGSEDDEINLYDFSCLEVTDGKFDACSVTENEELQPISIFHRASYDSKEIVLERLKAQVKRQLKDGTLKGVVLDSEKEDN